MPQINRTGMKGSGGADFTKPSFTSGPTGKVSPGGYDISSLKQQAEQMGDQADDYKYQIAVEMARSDLGDESDADESKFKEAIDRYYEELDPTNTGRDMRGENVFTDLVGGIGGFFDGAADLGGWAIDGLWDITAGNIGSLLGAGDDLKNLFDAEDASLIADGLIDVGLSSIPGVGYGLAAIKNLSQSAPTITEAVTGKDVITNEELNANSKLGTIGSALLAGAGALIPGAGKTRQALGLLDDVAKGAGKTVAKEAAEGAGKAVAKEAAEGAGKAAAKGAGKAAAKEAAESTGEAAAKAAAQSPGGFKGVIDNAVGKVKGGQKYVSDLRSDLADNGIGAAIKNRQGDIKRAVFGNVAHPFLSTISRTGIPLSAVWLNTMAETGLDPGESAALALQNFVQDPNAIIAASSAPGVRRLALNLPTVNGKASRFNIPGNLVVGSNMANHLDMQRPNLADTDGIDTTGMTQNEMDEWLKYARSQYAD